MRTSILPTHGRRALVNELAKKSLTRAVRSQAHHMPLRYCMVKMDLGSTPHHTAYARSRRRTTRTRTRLDRPHSPSHAPSIPRPRRAAHKAHLAVRPMCASGTGTTGGDGHSLRRPLRSRAREMGVARAGRSALSLDLPIHARQGPGATRVLHAAWVKGI